MAYIYDYQANPEYGYEDEETRRRREEERRIAEEQGLVPVRQVEQQAEPAPTGPAKPEEIVNYLQKNESGSNPNIGYHFAPDQQGQRKSTAFGAFGITQPAYKDIQQADPYFRNRSIESLSLDEQRRAQNTLNTVYTKQLGAYGLEPTTGNILNANFLGAKGLSEFRRTGAISPAAAAANGGEENVRRIIAERDRFRPAPTSGAAVEAGVGAPVDPEELERRSQEQSKFALTDFTKTMTGFKAPPQQPDPIMQASQTFIQNQNDPATLLKIREDQNQPESRRRAASEQLYSIINNEESLRRGQEQLQDLSMRMAQNDPKATQQLTKEISSKEGSWVKYAIWSLLGAKALADQEEVKLGIGDKWTQSSITMPDGASKTVEVLVAKDGSIRRARDIGTDEPIDPKLLGQITIGQKGVEQGQDVFMDPTGRVKGTFVLERRPGQTPIYKEIGTGRSATAAESAVLRKTGVQGTLEDQRSRRVQEINLRLEGKTKEEQMAILRPTNQQLIAEGYRPIDINELPAMRAPQIGGQAPAPAPTTGAAPTPTIGAQPTTGAAPPTTGVRPTATQIAAGKEEAKAFVKYKDEDIADKASKGSQINAIRKEQLYGADGILQNPELVGFLQATGGTAAEAGNVLRDLIAGNFKSVDDLSGRIGQLNLSQRQKDVLYRQINLSRQIDPLTLKANAGAGAVSDAEQRANRQANIDISRQTLYSAATDMTRQQFFNDLGQAKLAFSNARPDLNTRAKFDAAWSAEKRKIEEQYAKIFEARAAYIQKYNPDGSRPGAVVDAFKYYPVPEYNSQSGTWDLKTDYNRRAVRPKLNEFVR